MQHDLFDLAKTIIQEDGPSNILRQICETEKLSPESQHLLLDVGADMLTTIAERACIVAQSRNSNQLELSDVQFVLQRCEFETNDADVETLYDQEQAKGSPQHKARLELIRNFNQNNTDEQ